MKLKPRLHLIIATNEKGGASKSSSCDEAWILTVEYLLQHT